MVEKVVGEFSGALVAVTITSEPMMAEGFSLIFSVVSLLIFKVDEYFS